MGCKIIFDKVGCRNWIAIMVFLTTYINYTTRSNISISLPAMVHSGKKAVVPDCKKDEPVTNVTKPEADTGTKYEWGQNVQGYILGGYFYGYLLGSLLAGPICDWFGSFQVIFWTTCWSGILNTGCVFVTPIHWSLMFLGRVLIGFLAGLVYPALQTLIGRWSTPADRGKFVSALMGNTLGTCLTWMLVGKVTSTLKWPWGFHVVTLQCLATLPIFWVFLADSPDTHKWITPEELDYIKNAQAGIVSKKKGRSPYLQILTSFPFWCLTILHTGNLWGLYTQITSVPKFMKEVIGFNIATSGFLSSLPHLVRLFFGIGYGQIGDYLKRKKVKRVKILKSFILLSHVIPGILMASMGAVGCHATAAITLLVLSCSINGAVTLTNLANPTDLSPNFAGTIFGIISFIGGTTGFIVPSLSACFINMFGNNIKAWTFTFAAGGSAYFFSGIFFMVFGSAEVQPWNEKKETEPGEGDAAGTT